MLERIERKATDLKFGRIEFECIAYIRSGEVIQVEISPLKEYQKVSVSDVKEVVE